MLIKSNWHKPVKTNFLLIFIIILFISISCEEKFDLHNKYSKLVVNGFFSPEVPVRINISKSMNVFDNTLVQFIKDADIRLYEDEIYIGTLLYEVDEYYGSNVGWYSIPDFLTEAQKNYRIEIISDGVSDVISSDIIPNPVEIISIDTSWIFPYGRPDPESILFGWLKCKIKFKDPGLIRNYYYLSPYYVFYAGYPEPRKAYSHYLSEDPVIEGWTVGKCFFSDIGFNNEIYELTVTFVEPLMTSGNSRQILYINLWSISQSFYNYLKSYVAQVLSEQDFYAEPVKVYSNIEGGYGIFAGYSVAVDSITIYDNLVIDDDDDDIDTLKTYNR